MGYSRYLMDNESIVLETRRHVSTLVRPLIAAVGAVIGALLVGAVATPRDGRDLLDIALSVVAALFVIRFLWRILQWRATRTVVTNRRLLQVSGVVTRNVSSMPLARMTDLTYRRPLLGRLLGYGEIVVESAGAEQQISRLDHLPRPDYAYRTITNLVSELTPRRPDDDRGAGPNWDEEDTGPLPRVVV